MACRSQNCGCLAPSVVVETESAKGTVMARTPQRADRWSLRQVSLAAGVSLATARAVVRVGHLDPAALTAGDVVVLKVAAMLPSLQPLGELRPANAARQVPQRELEAVTLVRNAGGALAEIATLVVTATGARLATSIAEVSAATLEPVTQGEAYLALPVGRWVHELRLEASPVAA